MGRSCRADARNDVVSPPVSRSSDVRSGREPARDTPRVPIEGLALPRGDRREPVSVAGRTYQLRGSEARTLATVGAFRLVPAEQLDDRRGGLWTSDLQRLSEQGLIERMTITVNERPTPMVVLTTEGKALLDETRDSAVSGARQEFHAGLVKPREAAHDAQLHALFQAEGARIEAAGGRIERVVLDYELKREYQSFLNRRDRPSDATVDSDRLLFAAAHGLPIVDGHLELPDLRIEYETSDGRHESRDVELVTEHYSRGQLAGKARAGFSRYRAAGSGTSRRGGTPVDPHHLEWLG